MQQVEQGVLVFCVADAVPLTDADKFFVGDVRRAEGFHLVFDGEIIRAEEDAHLRHGADFLLNFLAQFCDVFARAGGRADEAANVGILFAQAAFFDVHFVLVAFVADQNDGRVLAVGVDERQPIFNVILFERFSRIEDQQVQTAPREKELVRGVHVFLPAEIPHLRADVAQRQGTLFDNQGGVFFVVEGVVNQPLNDGGLAHAAFAHHEDARFAQFTSAFFVDAFVVGEDFLGVVASIPSISHPSNGNGNFERIIP